MTVIRVSSFGSVRFARGYGVNQGCKNPSSNNTELNKMAKGENLEKPKKGGMVIVIGVGAKPKKDKMAMKKAEGRRAPRRRGSVQDNQRGRIHAFKQKLRSNPYHLEEVLEQKNIPYDSFETYFHDKHDKTLDEAVEDGSVDIPREIDEAAQIIRGNEGQFRNGQPNQNLARLLERRQINPDDFRESLRRHPFMEFRERVDSLAESAANQRMNERSPPRSDRQQQPREGNRRAQLRDAGLGEFQIDEQLEHDRLVADEDEAYRARDEARGYGKKADDRNDEDADEMFDRLARIFENRGYRNPMQAAFEAMQGLPQGRELGASAFNPEEDSYIDTHWRGSARYEPSTVFTVPFQGGGQMADRDLVGRHSPKGSVEAQLYGFRGPSPIVSSNKKPIEDQEADMDAVEADMYGLKRTSYDSTNVMDEAWALLKQSEDYGDVSVALDQEEEDEKKRAMKRAMEALVNRPLPPKREDPRVSREAAGTYYAPNFASFQQRGTENDGSDRQTNLINNRINMVRGTYNPPKGMLKGNPEMLDEDGNPIHPAAMIYNDLAAQMEAREPPAQYYDEDSETAADRMEEMRRRPQHYDFHTDIGPPLDRMRREARMQTHQMMSNPDSTAGPQRGILTSESREARRKAQRAQQEAEAKKRRDENTKNIRMKPGNIMDQM